MEPAGGRTRPLLCVRSGEKKEGRTGMVVSNLTIPFSGAYARALLLFLLHILF